MPQGRGGSGGDVSGEVRVADQGPSGSGGVRPPAVEDHGVGARRRDVLVAVHAGGADRQLDGMAEHDAGEDSPPAGPGRGVEHHPEAVAQVERLEKSQELPGCARAKARLARRSPGGHRAH
jgi:hypothetical protein